MSWNYITVAVLSAHVLCEMAMGRSLYNISKRFRLMMFKICINCRGNGFNSAGRSHSLHEPLQRSHAEN